MREGPFDALAPLAHQAASAGATHATSVAIYRRFGLGRLRPIASSPVRPRELGSPPHGVEVDHRLIAVIALVRNDLFQRLRLGDADLRVSNLIGPARRRLPPPPRAAGG